MATSANNVSAPPTAFDLPSSGPTSAPKTVKSVSKPSMDDGYRPEKNEVSIQESSDGTKKLVKIEVPNYEAISEARNKIGQAVENVAVRIFTTPVIANLLSGRKWSAPVQAEGAKTTSVSHKPFGTTILYTNSGKEDDGTVTANAIRFTPLSSYTSQLVDAPFSPQGNEDLYIKFPKKAMNKLYMTTEKALTVSDVLSGRVTYVAATLLNATLGWLPGHKLLTLPLLAAIRATTLVAGVALTAVAATAGLVAIGFVSATLAVGKVFHVAFEKFAGTKAGAAIIAAAVIAGTAVAKAAKKVGTKVWEVLKAVAKLVYEVAKRIFTGIHDWWYRYDIKMEAMAQVIMAQSDVIASSVSNIDEKKAEKLRVATERLRTVFPKLASQVETRKDDLDDEFEILGLNEQDSAIIDLQNPEDSKQEQLDD